MTTQTTQKVALITGIAGQDGFPCIADANFKLHDVTVPVEG